MDRRKLFSGLLPDRHLLSALVSKWLTVPAFPTIAKAQPGKLCHQVQLGGPHVPERNRAVRRVMSLRLVPNAAAKRYGVDVAETDSRQLGKLPHTPNPAH